MQRLAADLLARSHGLHRGHIGNICDALTAAGIDPAVWSARAITDVLNRDMRERGWSWPDRIELPAAFLSSRLRRLDWRPKGPPQAGGTAAGGLDGNDGAVAPAYAPAPRVVLTEAQRRRRRQQLDDAIAEVRRRCAEKAPSGDRAPAAAVPVAGVCVRCGGPDPVRRRWLPTGRAELCDRCWHAFMATPSPPDQYAGADDRSGVAERDAGDG